jgi:hypothetical protein
MRCTCMCATTGVPGAAAVDAEQAHLIGELECDAAGDGAGGPGACCPRQGELSAARTLPCHCTRRSIAAVLQVHRISTVQV